MMLGWYIARLRSMSAPELVHRVGEKIKKTRAKGRLEGWARHAGGDGGSVPALPGFADALRGADAAMRATIAAAAGDVLGGRFSALGREWPRFDMPEGADPLWHLDPVTGRHWPSDAYCFAIRYRTAHGIGDVKYVWEFSRLQFLQPVAAHAFLHGDAESLAFIERAIASWHASNPPFRGVGWSSGIELALRAISLLVVSSLVGDRLSDATRTRIAEMLRAHAFWLARYPSRFSSANNHLVSEEAALFLIGLACPFLPGAARMAGVAGAAVAREAGLQLAADGEPAEQSPTYGALTAELILLCAFVGRAAGHGLAEPAERRLAAFAGFVDALADDEGHVAAIGDDDEGRVLTLARHETRYASSVASAIAGLLGRGDLAVPTVRDLRNAILPAPAPVPHTRGIATAGYTVHRATIAGRSAILAIDHAPLGYLAIAAHGHADALAVWLTLDGVPVLADAGTYLYHSGGAWRDWFRGTRAHNTLTVEGADQSLISGAFNWSHKAVARRDAVTGSPFSVRASHDGYVGRFGVRHERTVTIENDAIVLLDRLTGTQDRTGELVLQLGLGCTATRDGEAIIIASGDDALATLMLPPGGTIAIRTGEDAMDGGWLSPAFGDRRPATRLAWTGPIGDAGVTTRIAVHERSGERG